MHRLSSSKPAMGSWFSSSDDGPVRSTITPNVSVNEEKDSFIRLTYTVGSAKRSNCSFRWEKRNSGYVGVMEARDGGTLYTHTFPRVVPNDTVENLEGPRKEKIKDRVIFTFGRSDKKYSLQDYVRN